MSCRWPLRTSDFRLPLLLYRQQFCTGRKREHWALKKLLVIIPILALSACVVQPKEGSETLRVVGGNHECEVIAVVVGEGVKGAKKARADEGAINQARNRAVTAGANAIYFADTHSKIWGSMVVADALKC
jgi:hypothetical protein